jgi:hypothetical protein
MTPEIKEIFDDYPWRTVRQGAATSVLLAASPVLKDVGGRYFESCQEALPYDPAATAPEVSGVAAHALDPESARRLWDVSAALVTRV